MNPEVRGGGLGSDVRAECQRALWGEFLLFSQQHSDLGVEMVEEGVNSVITEQECLGGTVMLGVTSALAEGSPAKEEEYRAWSQLAWD